MPYIKQERRKELQPLIDKLLQYFTVPNNQGVFNNNIKIDLYDLEYILLGIHDCIIPSYNNYKNFYGELIECAYEIERRFCLISKIQLLDPPLKKVYNEQILNGLIFDLSAELKFDGDLNYILFYIFRHYIMHESLSFRAKYKNNLIKITEWKRSTVLCYYEDLKIIENGDV